MERHKGYRSKCIKATNGKLVQENLNEEEHNHEKHER